MTYAEPLLNCRREPYPNGLDLYAHPKMRAAMTLLNLSIVGAGHLPAYGDTAPDLSRVEVEAEAGERERPDGRREALREDTQGGRKGQGGGAAVLSCRRRVGGTPGEPGDPKWLLFHQTEPPAQVPPLPAGFERRITGTHFLGQEGLGMLRTGARGETALLLRFGPSLNHGHFDDLGYNLFGLGYELTYDLGYELANTHTQVGFAKQTTSHNLVVVDETSQQGLTGGSLHLFADFPGVKVIEASSENSYAGKGVSLYRRTMALIGDGPGAYLVDLFRVQGGSHHDYFAHFRGKLGTVGGVALGPARTRIARRPRIAWGSKQLNDGDMEGHPNQFYWNPPPGNGYGFLVHPRRGKMTGPVSAEWRANQDAHIQDYHGPRAAYGDRHSGRPRDQTELSPGRLPDRPPPGQGPRERVRLGHRAIQRIAAVLSLESLPLEDGAITSLRGSQETKFNPSAPYNDKMARPKRSSK